MLKWFSWWHPGAEASSALTVCHCYSVCSDVCTGNLTSCLFNEAFFSYLCQLSHRTFKSSSKFSDYCWIIVFSPSAQSYVQKQANSLHLCDHVNEIKLTWFLLKFYVAFMWSQINWKNNFPVWEILHGRPLMSEKHVGDFFEHQFSTWRHKYKNKI